MGIIIWLLIGLVAGWLASQVMHSPHGILMDLLLGIVGSFVGGFLSSAIFGWKPQSITGSLIVAFAGSVILIAIHRALFGGRRAHA
ncbi:MAG TPA: GlsB/YeaQ/YmgE family stress response membrane protein [Dehalococcoidia bacterium]|nr:GlsB/YeaQ/YmgE family stress response membrane protein [Dehalococcoidia bacterium]